MSVGNALKRLKNTISMQSSTLSSNIRKIYLTDINSVDMKFEPTYGIEI